jgi:hypothetical protein
MNTVTGRIIDKNLKNQIFFKVLDSASKHFGKELLYLAPAHTERGEYTGVVLQIDSKGNSEIFDSSVVEKVLK